MSELTFEQMLEESFKTIRNGEVVDGTVIDVKPDEIILNIGYKADGIITRNEYTNEANVDLTTVVSVGDKMSAKVLKVNDGEGQVLLTYKRLAAEKGNEYLHQMLQEVDPVSAREIHANNVKRVIRALEFYHQNGTPISAHNEEQKKQTSPYNLAYFVLNAPRDILYERIDKRVDQMLEEGLVKEVEGLKREGCHRGMVSMQGLGYKEILEYLDGECSLEEAVYTLKRDTRHFAKRQITWFRRENAVTWLDKQQFDYDEEKILEYMIKELGEKGIYEKQQ